MTLAHEFPTDFSSDFQPLRYEHDLGERGNAALEDLASRGFVVATGVRREQLGRLADMSAESHIREFCPNDTNRFGDEQKVARWLAKGRVMVGIYSVGQAVDLNAGARMTEIGPEDVTQVAYGWFGRERNDAIPDADITTAYRVSRLGSRQARERRCGDEDKFKLGYPLGEMVTAIAAGLYHVGPRLSLETWASNPANDLYDKMGYVQHAQKDDVRPTLRPVGEDINGHAVYYDAEYKGTGANVVQDTRLFKRLADHPLLESA